MSQKGVAHILLLVLLLAGLVVGVFLVSSGNPLKLFSKASEKKQEPTVTLQKQYQNPFDKSAQYVNPFSSYKNPFDSLK